MKAKKITSILNTLTPSYGFAPLQVAHQLGRLGIRPGSWRVAADLPAWGAMPNTSGRAFITHQSVVYATRVTLWLDRVPVWGTIVDLYDGSATVVGGWYDPREARDARESFRARERERNDSYAVSLAMAATLVEVGVPLEYRHGQDGGAFLVSRGDETSRVSAQGLAKRLGIIFDYDFVERVIEGSPGPAPHLSRRERRNPIVFDQHAAG